MILYDIVGKEKDPPEMKTMEYTTQTYDDEGTFRTYTGAHVRAIVQELDDGCGYIERIDVDEGFRGQGIGTEAIREIAGDFDSLFAAPDNEGAARLYARIGEQVVGEDIDAAAPLECLYYLDQGFGVYEIA